MRAMKENSLMTDGQHNLRIQRVAMPPPLLLAGYAYVCSIEPSTSQLYFYSIIIPTHIQTFIPKVGLKPATCGILLVLFRTFTDFATIISEFYNS